MPRPATTVKGDSSIPHLTKNILFRKSPLSSTHHPPKNILNRVFFFPVAACRSAQGQARMEKKTSVSSALSLRIRYTM